MQVPVPRHSVGVVIGRNGEMIKKIQNDAGVRIQFKPGEVNGRRSAEGPGLPCGMPSRPSRSALTLAAAAADRVSLSCR